MSEIVQTGRAVQIPRALAPFAIGLPSHVRFWHLADIPLDAEHVRS